MATRRRSTAAPEPEAAPAVRVLKKYPNRRLYDTQASAYVTLADVKAMVLAGEAFEVRDRFCQPGLPQGLTDSELILTQLSAEGYQTSKTFEGADLVIVNTCGFIDDAVKESLDTIGEALAENGKVIVTGCLGARPGDGGGNLVQQMHPKVLAVTGPHATQEVMDAVHRTCPSRTTRFSTWCRRVWRGGHQAHAAPLRLPEDQRRLQPPLHLLHHPVHARRPGVAPHWRCAEGGAALFEGGVKELLVISQDTSAYGVDVKYRTGFWDGKPVKTRMLELVQALGELAAPYGAWVRLHYVYPYPAWTRSFR
jgi:ribosomal protein S12 methylthiotransferase